MNAVCAQGAAPARVRDPGKIGAGDPVISGDAAAAERPGGRTGRFVGAGGHEWHIRELGQGPDVLLLHGTGASTHSWRGLGPILARHFRLLIPDMPGHGLTVSPRNLKLGLPTMCKAVAALLQRLRIRPTLAIGHSAGAAVLVRMSLDGLIEPAALVSINGALLPLQGIPGLLFSPVARLLVSNRAAPHVLAWRASRPGVVDRVIENTGSKLDAEGVAHYRRLCEDPNHVAGALNMMANWRLTSLAEDFPGLKTPLFLVVGENDSTVSPKLADRVRELNPAARRVSLPGLGHLAHEEQPRRTAAVLLNIAREAGIRPTREVRHGRGA